MRSQVEIIERAGAVYHVCVFRMASEKRRAELHASRSDKEHAWRTLLGDAERVGDCVADRLGVCPEVEQDARGDSLVLTDEAEQEVLGSDVVVTESYRLAER